METPRRRCLTSTTGSLPIQSITNSCWFHNGCLAHMHLQDIYLKAVYLVYSAAIKDMPVNFGRLMGVLLVMVLSTTAQSAKDRVMPVFHNVSLSDSALKLSRWEQLQKASPHQKDKPIMDTPPPPHMKLVIQNGKVTSGTQTQSNGVQFLLQAMQRALSLAQQIVQNTCADIDLRAAPLKYEDLGPTGALMQVSAPFVLMKLPHLYPRMGYVFLPAALVRGLLANPNNKVIWTSTTGEYHPTSAEETDLLNKLWISVPFDMYITINTRVNFAIGDSDCALVSTSGGYFSAVSTIVHELLHGAGVYSLLEADRSGALQGHASVFDALLKTSPAECTDCFVFDNQNVHHITGNQLAGQQLYVNDSLLYNPNTFSSGSSLSHFASQDSIMNSTIAHSTCRFTLTSQDVQALTELGWQQCNKSATPHVWDTHDTLLPEALMRQLSDLTATDTLQATPSNSTAHHHDDCLRRHSTWVVTTTAPTTMQPAFGSWCLSSSLAYAW